MYTWPTVPYENKEGEGMQCSLISSVFASHTNLIFPERKFFAPEIRMAFPRPRPVRAGSRDERRAGSGDETNWPIK